MPCSLLGALAGSIWVSCALLGALASSIWVPCALLGGLAGSIWAPFALLAALAGSMCAFGRPGWFDVGANDCPNDPIFVLPWAALPWCSGLLCCSGLPAAPLCPTALAWPACCSALPYCALAALAWCRGLQWFCPQAEQICSTKLLGKTFSSLLSAVQLAAFLFTRRWISTGAL